MFVHGMAYNFTTLNANSLHHLHHDQINVNSFEIDSISLKNFTNTTSKFNKKGIMVEIQIGRSIGSIFLVTYLPTIIINIINQVSRMLLVQIWQLMGQQLKNTWTSFPGFHNTVTRI